MNKILITLSTIAVLAISSCSKKGESISCFNTSKIKVDVGDSVTFTNCSISTEEGITTTNVWSFGDGTTSTQASPSHSYAKRGGYTVTLTAYGQNGMTVSSSSQAITVMNPNEKFDNSYSGLITRTFPDKTSSKDPGFFNVQKSNTNPNMVKLMNALNATNVNGNLGEINGMVKGNTITVDIPADSFAFSNIGGAAIGKLTSFSASIEESTQKMTVNYSINITSKPLFSTVQLGTYNFTFTTRD